MAHFVAKKLCMRPAYVLDNWSCSELLVAFGQYANEDAVQAYEQWEYAHGNKAGTVPPKPKRYIVEFING